MGVKDPATKITATFQRPATGTLMVKLDDGTEWAATEEDLDKMGFVYRRSLQERIHDLLVQLYNYHGEGVVERDDLTRGGTPYLNLIRYLTDSVIGGLHDDEDIIVKPDWACLRHLVMLDSEYRRGNIQFDLTKVEDRD